MGELCICPDDALRACTTALPAAAARALSILEHAGAEAWLVGGFVRDALMGRAIGDIDIACNLPADVTREVFEQADVSTIPTGIAHGTITAILDGDPIEITTYRIDGAYSDSRHPDNVFPAASIREDLARRDFTVNAMAFHPDCGLVDPYGGIEDLKRRILRTVGEPQRRFAEDALRVLRLCRFCSQLGFDIEPETLYEAGRCKRYLHAVSKERIASELEKFVCGAYVHDALMLCFGIVEAVLPELAACKDFDQCTPYHIYTVLEHIAYATQYAQPDAPSRWAALFHDAGKPASFWLETLEDGSTRGHFYGHEQVSLVLAQAAFQRLKLPRSTADRALTLIRFHDRPIEPTKRAVQRMLRKFNGDEDLFRRLVDLKVADAKAQAPGSLQRVHEAQRLLEIFADIQREEEPFSLSHLAISGHDLIDAGLSPGPRIGRILNACLDATIDGAVPNDKEALLSYGLHFDE